MESNGGRVGFLYDVGLREAANAAGRNYWYEYVRQIGDRLGVAFDEVAPEELAAAAASGKYAALFIGGLGQAPVSPDDDALLERYVERGGTLVVFAAAGLDGLCGNEPAEWIRQPGDDFTISGLFRLVDDPTTRGVHSERHPDQPLVIFSDIRPVAPSSSRALARLALADGADTGKAALTERRLGGGAAYYFAFDVPKTMWVLNAGRPVVADYDGDGYFRSMDAIAIRPHTVEVPYSDEIALLLQSIVARRPVPMIHQIPPLDGAVADALFYYGGDDEGASDGVQEEASSWMHERRLPYHINVMPRRGEFALAPEEARRIRERGHEISLHYNFIDDREHPHRLRADEIAEQAELFRSRFGHGFTCTVFHWMSWSDWAEPARYMLAAGGRADNSRAPTGSPPLNPANTMGFAFGTAFPFWVHDDHTGANRRLDFLIEPVVCYEVGYRKDGTDFDLLRRAIDLAARGHLTMDFFFHPVYIARYATCQAAIEELLRYVGERGHLIVHMANDALHDWWRARAHSSVDRVRVERGRALLRSFGASGGAGLRSLGEGGRVSFRASCAYRHGMVVKLPLGGRAGRARVDGSPAATRVMREAGREYLYIVCPEGEHDVDIELCPGEH